MPKTKITHEGQPCRKCGTPVERRTYNGTRSPGQRFYFAYFFRCPGCGTLYLVPAAKRLFDNPS